MNKIAIWLLDQVSQFFDELDTDEWPPALDSLISYWLKMYGSEVPANDDQAIVDFFAAHKEYHREDWD